MAGSPDYGFLRRPLWLAGVALALAGMAVFVLLGLWQLDRRAEKRAFNDLLAGRLAAAPVPLEELLAEAGGDPEAIRFRRTVATGTFAPDDEVLLAGRSYLGQPGYHVLTPLLVGGGQGVVVDRGWVPFDTNGPPVLAAPPPAGVVTVRGVIDTSAAGRPFGSPGPDGRVTRVGRIDLDRLDAQMDASLAAVYIVLDGSGSGEEVPIPEGPTALSEGPHLGYAIQWFLFAVVVAVGFPILLYRTARQRQPGASRTTSEPP